MPSDNIIIPVAQPEQTGARGVGVSFSQGDGAIKATQVGVTGEVAAQDLMVGNAAYHPWVVMVPWQRSMLDIELQYALMFIRSPRADLALALAPEAWQRHVVPAYPRWYPAEADYCGECSAVSMDESDWSEIFAGALKRYKQDADKYPMMAFGVRNNPSIFCPIWLGKENSDFKFLESAWLDNKIVRNGNGPKKKY